MTFGKIWAWLSGLFGFGRPHDPRARRISWPTKEQIEQLKPFEAMGLDRIIVIETPEDARRVKEEIIAAGVVGFDTESKPTFVKGHKSTGPHVAQFSTLTHCFIFMLHDSVSRRTAGEIIASPRVKKVGFGLSEDLRRIPVKFNVRPHAVVDLESILRARGYGMGMGVKVAVAVTLKRRFAKSKSAATSNWMRRELVEKQLLYAANDAYAAIKVFEKLGFPEA